MGKCSKCVHEKVCGVKLLMDGCEDNFTDRAFVIEAGSVGLKSLFEAYLNGSMIRLRDGTGDMIFCSLRDYVEFVEREV